MKYFSKNTFVTDVYPQMVYMINRENGSIISKLMSTVGELAKYIDEAQDYGYEIISEKNGY